MPLLALAGIGMAVTSCAVMAAALVRVGATGDRLQHQLFQEQLARRSATRERADDRDVPQQRAA